MISRAGLIALMSLLGLALSTSSASAQTTRNYIRIVLSDITVSSMRGGRTVSTTRTDGQGGFRFDLAAGDYNICLNGPGLRSVIDRSGGSQGNDHIIGVLIGLLLPAVPIPSTERQLTFPSGGGGPGERGPSSAARDLCFPYRVDAGPGPAGGLDTRRSNQPTVSLDTDNFRAQAPASDGRAGGVQVAAGDVNGDGRADQIGDPRVPPPGVTARSAGLRTVAVTGTVRLVR